MTQGKLSVSHKPPEGQGGHKDTPVAPPGPPSYEEATAGEGMKAGNVPPPPPGWNFGDPGPGSGEFPGDTEPLGPLGWDDGNVRRLFVRKVYALLLLQLLLTTGVVALFTFCDPVKGYIQTHPAWYWASYAVFFLTYLVLACCSGLRRRFPWNLILLGIFTLSLAYLTAMLSSYYDTKAVLLCLGITALVCLGISILSFQSKLDFTSCQGILAVLLLVLLLGGILLGLLLPSGYVSHSQKTQT
ncbi:protein lifeguard 2, partial [Pipra filicauda]|uniref:Protein lifeguard 2 n=1 Tax=Pipra filicauda TaxID=649802 RepID=A0A7R5KC89_9PASS